MAAELVLGIGGDVCCARAVADGIRRHGGSFPFGAMDAVLRRADLFTANFESPVLPPGQEPPAKGLVVPDDLAATLTLPVPAAFSIANNHIFDAGETAIEFTRRRLEALGFSPFGAGATAAVARKLRVVKVKGLRVGFLGRTEDCPQLRGRMAPGPALIKRKALVADVAAARRSRRADLLVVHLHQGVEFVDWPAPRLVDLARSLVKAGADIVASHHPHVPQGWERHGRALIFYGLGNLVFDAINHAYLREGSRWTNRSFVALVPIANGGVGDPTLVPYEITNLGRPVPLQGAEADDVLAHVADISKDLADRDALNQHWRETCIRYLGINIDWTFSAWKSDTPDELLNSYFTRFGYDELRGLFRDLFANTTWMRNLGREPWN